MGAGPEVGTPLFSRLVRIDHVGLWAVDLERLRAFYETYLGGRSGPRFEDPRYGFASYFVAFGVDGAGPRLELMSMPSIPPTRNDPAAQFTGLVHLAFSLGSRAAVDDLVARLRREGHRIVDEPHETADGYYEGVVLDPEGNRIELAV